MLDDVAERTPEMAVLREPVVVREPAVVREPERAPAVVRPAEVRPATDDLLMPPSRLLYI